MTKANSTKSPTIKPATLDEAAAALDEIERIELEKIQGGMAPGGDAGLRMPAPMAYHY